nr:MAG TPA: TRYPTOPHAN RNA-BINDING ATTENUATOR PROTEIN-INHIBITORY PROTEIN REGULATION, ANTI-TRAP [Caudoviricetes sp.]
MGNILDRFRKSKETQEPKGVKRIKTIPPHVVACKVCEGRGNMDGRICEQCKGSGRVIVTCDVTTYVMAYTPETL